MSRETLKRRLLENRELYEQFEFEVAEREAIMSEKEGEFENIKTLALEATIEVWLNK